MTTYTEADFAKATFARHTDGRIAARSDSGHFPWRTNDGDWHASSSMAVSGWIPVTSAEPLPELHLTGGGPGPEVADVLRRIGYVHEVPTGTRIPPNTPFAYVLPSDMGKAVQVYPDGFVYAFTVGATRAFTREPLAKPDPAEQLAERLRPLLGDLLGQGLVSADLASELAGALTARGLTITEGGEQA